MVWGENGWDYKDFTVTLPAAAAAVIVPHELNSSKIRRIDGVFYDGQDPYQFYFIDELGGRNRQVVARCNTWQLIVYCSDVINPAIIGTEALVRVWYQP